MRARLDGGPEVGEESTWKRVPVMIVLVYSSVPSLLVRDWEVDMALGPKYAIACSPVS